MEWISVKDRLPEGDDTVVVYSGMGYGLAKYASFTGNWHIRPFFDECYQSKDCVTHWMPLPGPPNDKPDKPIIYVTISVSDNAKELTLDEFENAVYRNVQKAISGLKRNWGPHDD